MAKVIKRQINRRLILIMALISIFGFILCFICINSISQQYTLNLGRSATDFAETIIDADDAKNYLTTRVTDNNYDTTLQYIKSYEAKNPNIKRISLVSYSNSSGYYIYDTEDNPLGTKIEYNSYTSSIKAELINGRNQWNTSSGNSLFLYRPIRTLDDKLAGYIIVEINSKFKQNYLLIASISFGCMFILEMIFVFFLSRFMNKEIFIPIKNLSRTALDFTASVSNKNEIKTTELFTINKDNEVGYLGNAIQKMITDINSSTEDLSKAIYEATHDAMTQVFNKRHYNNTVSTFQNFSAICIIFFDVNNLKLMNDTLGHEHGDYVIKQAAEYIKRVTEDKHLCFRIGGDEFLVVMNDPSYYEIDRIIDTIEKDAPYILSPEEDSIKCALSYGYAYAKGEYSYDELFTEAEENMYKKKSELKTLLNMPDR